MGGKSLNLSLCISLEHQNLLIRKPLSLRHCTQDTTASDSQMQETMQEDHEPNCSSEVAPAPAISEDGDDNAMTKSEDALMQQLRMRWKGVRDPRKNKNHYFHSYAGVYHTD